MGKREKSVLELKLIENVSLVDYYNNVIVKLDNKFKPMNEVKPTGICPFHSDTDPSLHYWKKKNIFHCFGCGFGGDIIKTHLMIKNRYFNTKLSIEQVIKDLSLMYNIVLDEQEVLEEDIKQKLSIFDRVRLNLSDERYKINGFSLSKFTQLNNKVIRANVSERIKAENFSDLDIDMALYILKNK
jgi:hypothetical protein